MENRNTRGSEWRKWDLHIHTPNTAKNDNFIADSNNEIWETYINKIEATKDIAVLGITDYFSIENYLHLKNIQKNGQLSNVYLLPNVELRILPVTQTETPINLHVLFNPELDIDIINRDFFKQLKFNYNGSDYFCSKEDLIRLGKKYKNDEILTDDVAYKEGVNQFNISFQSVKDALQKDSLENNFIVCVSNSNKDGNSGIQGSSMCATRREIYRMSDIIFSANPSDINFFLGKNKSGEKNKKLEEEVISNYGSLKPCIRGCDAHDFNRMFVFDDNRFTWIKADPTFEGLKQIIYEPEERVRIQSEKPEEKNNYQIIDFISFNNREMGTQKIEFNQNLNTIIGGRSSGKSILLGCLASLIDENCKPKEKNEDYNSNIRKLIDNATAVWKDSTSETRKIIYYSQSQISEIVRPDKYGISGINGLVEDIVKKDSKKSELIQQYEKSLIANRTEINTKINDFCDLKKQIKEKNQSISDIGNKKGIIGGIENLQNEINTIKKSISDYLSEAEDKEFNEQKDNLEKLNLCKKYLHADEAQFSIAKDSELFVSLDSLISSFSNYSHDKVVEFYNKLKIDTKKIWTEFIDKQIKEIDTNETEANNKIKEIQDSELYKKGISFQTNNELLQKKEGDLSIEIQKKNNIEKIEEELKQLKVSLKILKNDIWKNYFKYKILTQELSKELETKRDEVEINANIKLLAKDFFETTFEVVNRRTKEVQKYEDYDSKTIDEQEEYIKEIFEGMIDEKIQLKRDFHQSLVNLFTNNYYKISYDVIYENDSFKMMSEGKKAFIVLRLLLDFDDSKCPIIIDQPEDDLDNRAIYDKLVCYLREQKKNRQIILATHNPNVVVGADSELVIVANQNGIDSPNQDGLKFEYYGNSIENTFIDKTCKTTLLSKGIREHICEILEGGNKAFQIREKKYGYTK